MGDGRREPLGLFSARPARASSSAPGGKVPAGMMALKANPKMSRQLALEGPMLLWRNKRGGGREGLLLTVDVCTNPSCTDRHVIIQARMVEDTLISAKLSPGKLVTKSRPGPSPGTRPGFYGSVGLEDGQLELRDAAPDRGAVAWFKAELDGELRAVLLTRFEGARRRVMGEAEEARNDLNYGGSRDHRRRDEGRAGAPQGGERGPQGARQQGRLDEGEREGGRIHLRSRPLLGDALPGAVAQTAGPRRRYP